MSGLRKDEDLGKNKLSFNRFYKNTLWVEGDFRHDLKTDTHSGVKTIDTIFSFLEFITYSRQSSLDIYIYLNERSLAINYLIQEFVDLNWQKYFSQVRLFINQVSIPPIQLPEHLEIKTVKYVGISSEVSMFSNWISQEKS